MKRMRAYTFPRRWFHGKLSREDASVLLGPKPPGSFLVRESIRAVGDYTISFRIASGVKHFKIISHEYGDYFIADNCFNSLSDVVEFYMNQFLCENRYLTQPVRPAKPVTSPSKPRRLVRAKFDYTATSPDELSFRKGDALTVLNGDDRNWLWASLQGQAFTGFAPSSLVEDVGLEMSEREAAAACQLPRRFHRTNWLHGKMDRKAAATLLEDKAVGAFLVRESTSPGDYALSFKVPAKVQHFKIVQKGAGRYECGGRSFDCLEAIVLRYKEDPLMDETCLQYPIAPLKVQPTSHAPPSRPPMPHSTAGKIRPAYHTPSTSQLRSACTPHALSTSYCHSA